MLPFVLYLLLALVATHPLWQKAGDHVFGLGGPMLNTWAMAWVNHQLPRDPIHLFDGNVFYPYPRTLALSEHLFVPSILGSPVLLVSDNPILAYNAVAMLTLALAGLGMFLLCRELTGSATASFAAGLLYAFHTWNINELSRIQIVSNQWFPFLLWTMVRYFRAPSAKRAAGVGATAALQSLSCMYWALYLPFVILPAFLVLEWRHRLSVKRLVPLGASLGVAAVLTAVFAVPYLQNARDFGLEREAPNPVPIDRYLDVNQQNWLYESRLGTARVNENAAHFLGFTAMVIGGIGCFRKLPYRPLFLIFIVAGFFLSLGHEIRLGDDRLAPGPYALLYDWLPGFRNVRYPERFSILVVLGLAPAFASGLTLVRGRAGGALVPLAGLLLFVEHLSVPLDLAYVPTGDAIPEVYRWLDREDVRVVAEVPSTRYWGERADADVMYFSTVHWKRTVQGLTSFPPPTFNFVRWRLFHFPDLETTEFLEKLGVDTVVLHPGARGFHPDGWTHVATFPEGHRVLHSPRSDGLRFQPPDSAVTRGLVELDPATWRVHGFTPGAEHVKDGDPNTVWSTVDPQQEHHFFAVRFPSLVRPALVSMETGGRYEFPMRFEVLGLLESGEWADLAFDREWTFDRFFRQLLYEPRRASIDLELDPPAVREIRVRITSTDPFEMPWTIADLRVYAHPGYADAE